MNEFTARELFLMGEAISLSWTNNINHWLDEIMTDTREPYSRSLLHEANRLHPVAETANEKAMREAVQAARIFINLNVDGTNQKSQAYKNYKQALEDIKQ